MTQVDAVFRAARLPRWALSADWPTAKGVPSTADIAVSAGRVVSIEPHGAAPVGARAVGCVTHDLRGAPVLPCMVEAHAHLDKTFTIERLGAFEPGLLAAIDAMHLDRVHWTAPDVYARASQALQWAWEAGVNHVRTHVDWWEPNATPLAWPVLGELAQEWAGRVTLERVSLMPLHLFTDRATADKLADVVASSGQGARMGGFVHSHNWDAEALEHLLGAAEAFSLDVDLHVDEELNPAAQGLAATARVMRDLRFSGRVVCSHACALAAQPEAQALATLDAVAEVAITLVSLPITNLLLQDARTGRTPRLRGLTLVKEASARGIPVLIGSDNVQDAFCRVGSYDPVEAFASGVLVAQLDEPFDHWTQALCRADWLTRGPLAPPLQAGSDADFVIFDKAGVAGFPSRTQPRRVVRQGALLVGPSSDEYVGRSPEGMPPSLGRPGARAARRDGDEVMKDDA
ncbi:MAG: amidohydrolase [Rhizobacter sp.]|nr:amidohydrolase [Rhizobacter sp.]